MYRCLARLVGVVAEGGGGKSSGKKDITGENDKHEVTLFRSVRQDGGNQARARQTIVICILPSMFSAICRGI